jgi:hypothetical protein
MKVASMTDAAMSQGLKLGFQTCGGEGGDFFNARDDAPSPPTRDSPRAGNDPAPVPATASSIS